MRRVCPLASKLGFRPRHIARISATVTFLSMTIVAEATTPHESLQPLAADAAALQMLVGEIPFRNGGGMGLRKLYSERGFRPIWLDEGRPNADAETVAVHLAAAQTESLDPIDYALPAVSIKGATSITPVEIAQADLAISEAVLRYATHLRTGRLLPTAMDRKWDIKAPPFDAAEWLSEAATEGRIGSALDGLAPPYPVYADLRRQLARYREFEAAGGWPLFPAEGPRKLEPGDRHPQVVQLRDRLAITDGPIPESVDPELYDESLVEAVKRFQDRHGLNQDGVVGYRTRKALSVPVHLRIAQLGAAMERWRWMPRDLGDAHILVNVPSATLWFAQNNEPVLSMRTIIGKYKRQTPTFASAVSYLVLNPKWYVPNRIAVEDLVPKAQKDPDYYQRAGFSIYDKETGEPVDPSSVDWSEYGKDKAMPFRLVQNAGDQNALGNIKFMFPNPYGVYLHDTSSPRLFQKDTRAFSSGCIRVEKPLELASDILSRQRSVTPDEVSELIAAAPTNRHLTLKETVPLYVVYMTAWADSDKAYFFDDLYKRDEDLINEMTTMHR